MPWCKYFIPKIAVPGIGPDDPDLNDHIMYAKCIKGHVLRDGDDWVLCENLPAPDAPCWQEGGETIFSLNRRQRYDATGQGSPEARSGNSSTPQSVRS